MSGQAWDQTSENIRMFCAQTRRAGPNNQSRMCNQTGMHEVSRPGRLEALRLPNMLPDAALMHVDVVRLPICWHPGCIRPLDVFGRPPSVLKLD